VLYKNISGEDNDLRLIEAQLRFFHLVGFSFTISPRVET
jgi:hypothetical protein